MCGCPGPGLALGELLMNVYERLWSKCRCERFSRSHQEKASLTLLVPDTPGIATVRLVFPQMVCDGILSID